VVLLLQKEVVSKILVDARLVCMCVCVCVCALERGGGEKRQKGKRSFLARAYVAATATTAVALK